MRVIAGRAKGMRLVGGGGSAIRPTTDRVKEALFAILGIRVEGASFLDLYAGAGDIGIEAWSRGADRVTLVDQDARAIRLIRQNLARCRCGEEVRVVQSEVRRFLLKGGPDGESRHDLIFLDPPYRVGLAEGTLELLASSSLLTLDAWVVAEHPFKKAPAESYGGLRRWRLERFGDTAVSFYVRSEIEEDG